MSQQILMDFLCVNKINLRQCVINTNKEWLVNKEGLKLNYFEPETPSRFIIEDLTIEKTVHEFSMSQLQGCCGVCVSFHEETYFSQQNKGWATRMDKLKKIITKIANFSCLICTLREENDINQKVKKRTSWNKLYQFNNSKTGNEILFGVFDLNNSGVICKNDWLNAENLLVDNHDARYYQFRELFEKEIEVKENKLNKFQKWLIRVFKLKV
jgi:hypothetical protein